MKVKVFFDLDGTLSDSAPGIYNGLRYAQEKANLRPLKENEFVTFIGPPMLNSLMRVWSLDVPEAEKVLELYREYYNKTGIFENSLYPHIKETLVSLTSLGIECAVCSAKPEVMVFRVLEHFGIKEFFTDISGAPLHGDYSGKGKILKEFKKKESFIGIMVGDRGSDISGALEADMTAVGVLWGYGTAEELKDADHLVSSPDEIVKIAEKMHLTSGFN